MFSNYTPQSMLKGRLTRSRDKIHPFYLLSPIARHLGKNYVLCIVNFAPHDSGNKQYKVKVIDLVSRSRSWQGSTKWFIPIPCTVLLPRKPWHVIASNGSHDSWPFTAYCCSQGVQNWLYTTHIFFLRMTSNVPVNSQFLQDLKICIYLAVYIHKTRFFKRFIFYLCCLPSHSGSFWHLKKFELLVVIFS